MNTIRPGTRGLVWLADVVPAGQGERGLGLVDHAVVVHVVRPRPGVRVLGQVLVAAGEGGRRRVLPRGKVVVLVGAWPRVVVAGGDRMPPREGKCGGRFCHELVII